MEVKAFAEKNIADLEATDTPWWAILLATLEGVAGIAGTAFGLKRATDVTGHFGVLSRAVDNSSAATKVAAAITNEIPGVKGITSESMSKLHHLAIENEI